MKGPASSSSSDPTSRYASTTCALSERRPTEDREHAGHRVHRGRVRGDVRLKILGALEFLVTGTPPDEETVPRIRSRIEIQVVLMFYFYCLNLCQTVNAFLRMANYGTLFSG